MRYLLCLGLTLLSAVAAWTQVANVSGDATSNATSAADRMLTPPPVSGQAYPVTFDSEERSNYLRYGVTFSSAYSDNVLGAASGHPVSDVNYSIWPTISLDRTTSRLHWDMTYAPGFTFYQRTDARNEADQSFLLALQYRVTSHVTVTISDRFQKSSNVFNQPGAGSTAISGGAQGPNILVIAPIADQLNNFANVGISYQYGANDMIGATGSFSNLDYSVPAQVPGLSDGNSQAGSAFYSHRFSRRHYVGATYQYQRLMSSSAGLEYQTRTDAGLLFYTVYPTPRLSMSLFGGPQYADTAQPALPSLKLQGISSSTWGPEAGASLNWLGRQTGAALSYSHLVSGGGGLTGAVRLDLASATVRQQFTKTLNGSVAAYYANNDTLNPSLLSNRGHTLSATAALERRLGQHFSLQLGYTRLHQTYNIPLIAGAPNTNREFVAVSYDFARPLGR